MKNLLALLMVLALFTFFACAAAFADSSWNCTCGKKNNTDNYCPSFGNPAPYWTCPSCGQKNSSNYCPKCGMKKTADNYSGSSSSSTTQKDRDDPVDLFTENERYDEYFTISIAYCEDLFTAEKCARKLRDAGYNAYLYETLTRSGYAVMLGSYDDEDDAQEFVDFLHTQSDVGGMYLDRSFICRHTRLSLDATCCYCDTWW